MKRVGEGGGGVRIDLEKKHVEKVRTDMCKYANRADRVKRVGGEGGGGLVR